MSRLTIVIVVVVPAWEGFQGNFPRDPEGDFIDEIWKPLQLSFLGMRR